MSVCVCACMHTLCPYMHTSVCVSMHAQMRVCMSIREAILHKYAIEMELY